MHTLEWEEMGRDSLICRTRGRLREPVKTEITWATVWTWLSEVRLEVNLWFNYFVMHLEILL